MLQKRLKKAYRQGLHVAADSEVNWKGEELQEIILPAQKWDPSFPLVAQGDFDRDGGQDQVALVTNEKNTVFWIAIFRASGELVIWPEGVKGSRD